MKYRDARDVGAPMNGFFNGISAIWTGGSGTTPSSDGCDNLYVLHTGAPWLPSMLLAKFFWPVDDQVLRNYRGAL